MLFGFYSVVSIMTGGKSQVISFITVMLIYYNYNVRSLRISLVVVVTVPLLVFATMINHVRKTTDLSAMFQLAVDFVKDRPDLLLPINSGEFVGPPRMLMDVINAIHNGNMSFSFGHTWFTDILVFVPRFIYPNRPLPVPELFVQLLHPEAPKGYGYGGFMPLDGYWAFGYIGVVVIMFMYGAIVSIIYKIVRNNISNGVVLLIYSFAFFMLVTTAIRTGFFGTVKSSLMFVAPFLIILFLSRKKSVKLTNY
jgi:hypothetical protein